MTDKNVKGMKKANIYPICFAILTVCLVSFVLLSGIFSLSIESSITGAAVLDTGITQESALNAIIQAEDDMEEMQEAGFGVVWVKDTLIDAKKYFEGEDYTALLKQIESINDTAERKKAEALLVKAQEKIGVDVDYKLVLEKTNAISERKKTAYEINDRIRAAELKIGDFEADGLDAMPLYEVLSNAKTEFKEERYDNAIGLLAQIDPGILDIESENTRIKTLYRAGKETALNFLKENYIAIIVTLVIIIAILLLSHNRIMVGISNRKISDMRIEKEVLIELMKKAQTSRYSKGSITKQTYDIKMLKYKERVMQIKQQMPVVQARLDKLSKMKRII